MTALKSKDLHERLVGGIPTPLNNMSSSVGMMKFPYIMKNKTCSKPPTRRSIQQFPRNTWLIRLERHVKRLPRQKMYTQQANVRGLIIYSLVFLRGVLFTSKIVYWRKFRSQTSDNMERWKAEQGRGTEKRKIRREKIRRERVRGQKIQMREKVGKSRNTVFFQWFVAQEGRKVGSLKRRVRSQLATGAMKNCTPLWREAHFQVKMYKTPQRRTTFGSWDVEKVHAVVARSTFPSQNVQNTPFSDHFWKLRCRKSARRCGAKHISKSKCTKHTILGPLLEVAMSKKCTPLWREAHFQVKSVKNWRSRTTFGGSDVEKVHAVVARSTFPSQNVQSTPFSDHFWKLRCRKSARRCGAKHISKSKCTKHTILGPLLEVAMSKKCTPLWREAHFQAKSVRNWRSRTTFGGSDVEKVHAVVARSTFRSQKCKKLRVLRLFWREDVEKVDTD